MVWFIIDDIKRPDFSVGGEFILKKIVSFLLVLSIFFGNVAELTGYATAASSRNVNLSSVDDTNLYKKNNYRDSGNAVSEVLASMTVADNVYSKTPRGRYLVSFKKEYSVNVPDVVYSESSGESVNKLVDVSASSFSELRQMQYDQDLEHKLDLYNVKSLESANAVYMELQPEEVNQLLSNPLIDSIEEDKPIQIADDQTLTQVEDQSIKESSQTIPWGIHSTGSYITRQFKGAGDSNVKVAVFDTGVFNHLDLNIAGGVSYVDSSIEYSDDNGHGTHIAGTIAALDNSIGVVGEAPGAELYAVKVADSTGTGYTSSVVQGIEWAIEHDISIINMSFVSSQYSEILHEAIKNATEAGIIIVAAAGNNGAGTDTLQYPAKYPEVVAVGAIEQSHHRSDFSATGDELDLLAPGFGIISTSMSGGYGVSSGTSNAAAHVTGAAALLWSYHPEWSSKQVIESLYNAATVLDTPHESGHGIVNVAKAEGVITGAIAPLSEENLSGLNTVLPSKPEGDIEIASYDRVNDGASIHPGDAVTVSLKLQGDQNGNNPHRSIVVKVTSVSNPTQIIATQTITGLQLNQAIPYTWQTSSSTPTGTYRITYSYPAFPSGLYDDVFIIYVTQAGAAEDTFEPNDTFLTAKNVYPGNSYISYISSASDVDYYKLTADEAGQIPIDLTVPSTADYELDIYNASGTQVGLSSHGTGQNEHVDLQVAKDAIYYIKVTGFSGQFSTSPYTLILGDIETQPLEVPTGLETVTYSNSIKLTWNSIPKAVSYKLRLNGADAGTSASNTFTFTNLNSSQGYTLEVAAVYAEGTSAYASIQASTILPELIVYHPQDVNQPSRSSQLFSFKPATTGVYRFFTSPYQGTGPAVDTELSIYNNLQLSKQLAANDDCGDSVFSEIRISLIGGQTYYVKLNGFDTTALRTRITADVVSSNIPYIQQDHPVDINEQSGDSNVYVFVPANTGKFRISTGRYAGNAGARANDTELSVFANVDMESTITNGYNDDKGDSTFSEVTVNLSAGIPYYVRVNEVNGGKVYSRLLVTSAGETSFNPLSTGIPVELSKASGEEAYLKFTPTATGKYRFFTSNYQATSRLNDTEVALYTDADLKNLLDSNDDAQNYKPYGEQFSKLETTLTAGTTYYVVVRSFGTLNGLQARFTVESMEHNNADTAMNLPFGELLTSDSYGNPLSISSLYDTDYYKIELTAPDQISLYLSQGNGTIEDVNGNIRGYFSLDGQMTFNLDSGTYYLKIESGWEGPAWGFSKFDYALSADINIIDYAQSKTQSSTMAALRASSTSLKNSFDATPGSGEHVTVQYKNKANNTKLKVQVRTANLANGILVYEYEKGGNFEKNTLTNILWDGYVNPNNENKWWYANYSETLTGSDQYWAKDGIYQIWVWSINGNKLKHEQVFVVQVINDPLNGLNIIPLPPKTEKGKKITANTKDCKSCKNYFDRYMIHPNDHAYELEYGTWFADVYGLTGIQKFAASAESLATCDVGSTSDRLHCALDNIGMIPILGDGADAINGVIYLINGDYVDALLSTGAMFPIAGSFVTAGKKVAYTGGKKVTRIFKNNPCGCLPEGTQIETDNGLKPIEQIKVGDLVLAKNVDTGQQDYKPVEQVYSNETDELITLRVADTDVQTTGNHPFWIKDKGWVPADELLVGDEVETADGSLLRINSISSNNVRTKIYNFTVQDYHTYYISEIGILTHNLTEACKLSNYANVSGSRLTARNSGSQASRLEAEVTKATGLEKPKYWAAHHIVPINDNRFPQAAKLRNIMNNAKIDLNSSANGVFLPMEKGVDKIEIDVYTLATHNGSHAESYFQFLLDELTPVQNDPAQVLSKLNEIRELLLTGKLKLGN